MEDNNIKNNIQTDGSAKASSAKKSAGKSGGNGKSKGGSGSAAANSKKSNGGSSAKNKGNNTAKNGTSEPKKEYGTERSRNWKQNNQSNQNNQNSQGGKKKGNASGTGKNASAKSNAGSAAKNGSRSSSQSKNSSSQGKGKGGQNKNGTSAGKPNGNRSKNTNTKKNQGNRNGSSAKNNVKKNSGNAALSSKNDNREELKAVLTAEEAVVAETTALVSEVTAVQTSAESVVEKAAETVIETAVETIDEATVLVSEENTSEPEKVAEQDVAEVETAESESAAADVSVEEADSAVGETQTDSGVDEETSVIPTEEESDHDGQADEPGTTDDAAELHETGSQAAEETGNVQETQPAEETETVSEAQSDSTETSADTETGDACDDAPVGDESEETPVAAVPDEVEEIPETESVTEEDKSTEEDVEVVSAPVTETETGDAQTGKPERTPIRKKVTGKMAAIAAGIALLVGSLSFYAYKKDIEYHNSLPYNVNEILCDDATDENGELTFTVSLAEDKKKSAKAKYAVTESAEAPAFDSPLWNDVEGSSFSFTLGKGHYYVHIMDENGVVTSDDENIAKLSGIYNVSLNPDKAYLAVGTIKGFDFDCTVLGNIDMEDVQWTLSDSSLAEIKENKILAKATGELTVSASINGQECGSAYVLITDLITLPDMDSYGKPLLEGDVYTEEEAALLDEILFDRVERAGYATRGGVVAATRFLCLEFPYRVPYFFENGRLSPSPGRWYADGEGRYYHRGLYLTDSKYADIDPDAVRYGPAHWGAPLMNWETKYHFVAGRKYPNGLDCSGFVSWCLINGGIEYGDVGAGPSTGVMDLSDVGDKRKITDELLQSDLIHAGDLIYTDGHMAIVIGISDTKIYVAEALFNCVRVTSFERRYSAVPHYLYSYIALMSDEYAAVGNGEGEFTDMWDWYEGMEDVEKYWNYSWW